MHVCFCTCQTHLIQTSFGVRSAVQEEVALEVHGVSTGCLTIGPMSRLFVELHGVGCARIYLLAGPDASQHHEPAMKGALISP